MRNQTSELWILLSDALPLSHRDSMVSEVYYEEVYPEVPFLIPDGDSVLFLCPTLQTRQKLRVKFVMETSSSERTKHGRHHFCSLASLQEDRRRTVSLATRENSLRIRHYINRLLNFGQKGEHFRISPKAPFREVQPNNLPQASQIC